MMAGGEQQPSTDEVAQFLRYLVGILSSIAPMPPELMARLGSDLKHFQPYIDPHPVADPSVFYRMAGMLCEDPNPTMGQLGRSLSRPLSTVSRMVSQLEERGYAERLRDATDARVVRVALTDVGRQLYEAVSNRQHAMLRAFLAA
jgi:hypothetical protein